MWKEIGGRIQSAKRKFGEDLLRERANFSHLRSTKPPRFIGDHVSCYPAARFLSERMASARSAISLCSMAPSSWPKTDRHRIALPRFMERRIADSDFIRSSRPQRSSTRRRSRHFSKIAPASKIKNRAGHHRRQCLDRHERGHY